MLLPLYEKGTTSAPPLKDPVLLHEAAIGPEGVIRDQHSVRGGSGWPMDIITMENIRCVAKSCIKWCEQQSNRHVCRDEVTGKEKSWGAEHILDCVKELSENESQMEVLR